MRNSRYVVYQHGCGLESCNIICPDIISSAYCGCYACALRVKKDFQPAGLFVRPLACVAFRNLAFCWPPTLALAAIAKCIAKFVFWVLKIKGNGLLR
ncbi:hypothetical protein OWV82_011125 [Melia azedarach]|uniref:Uncharacterized protein n=1 Tax=Melia azedarach TaxID=155640 RepID=A0ACC1Y0J7_MELAZ|nr:hypothetical protein OWV82_011125 [Melia azedarach]